MILPDGVKQLTTIEEVREAWDELFILQPDEENKLTEETVAFADNRRVAITADAIYVKLRGTVHAGENVELTDTLRIREPIVAELRAADKVKGDTDKTLCIVGALCKIPNADMDKMRASDMAIVSSVIATFLS